MDEKPAFFLIFFSLSSWIFQLPFNVSVSFVHLPIYTSNYSLKPCAPKGNFGIDLNNFC